MATFSDTTCARIQTQHQVWRRLQPRLGVTCKPPPGVDLKPHLAALREAFGPVRFSLDRFVKTIVDILANTPDANDRQEMADLLANVLDEMRAAGAAVTPQMLTLIPGLLDTVEKESDLNAACAQVDALCRFASASGVQIAAGLIKLAQSPDDIPEFRTKVIGALRDCGTDALTVVLGPLTALLAANEPREIRREACVTIGFLGVDGTPAVPCLERTILKDPDEEIRREATRALARTCQDVPKPKAFATLRDPSRRRLVLTLLASIGADGRALRRGLAEKWDLGTTEDVPSLHQRETQSAPKAGLDKWAIGIEHAGKWHVFKKGRPQGKDKEQWQHRGTLKGLRKGRQTRLLEAFAKGGGSLTRDAAIGLETKSESISLLEQQKLLALLKPEISNLRKIILDAIKMPRTTDERAPDPIRWECTTGGWQAVVQIGYVITKDTERNTGDNKLRFRTRDQLGDDDRMDFDKKKMA